MVVILAVIADCNEWEEIEDYAKEQKDFLKKLLKLTGGIPSAKTYERVISLIDCQELNKIFVDYFDEDRLMIIESGYEGGYQLTREKNHEAVITYEYYQTEKVNWYAEKELWEGLKSFGLVKKTIEKSDGTKVEGKRYYISSLLLNINTFSYAIRRHWNVENKLHWHMDFTFKSDDNTTMNKKALYNLQIIKKFCLTILNEVKKLQNRSLKRIRKSISRNVEKETVEIFKMLRNFDTSTVSKAR